MDDFIKSRSHHITRSGETLPQITPELLTKLPRFTERDRQLQQQIRERLSLLSVCLLPRERDHIRHLLSWRDRRFADHAKACHVYETTIYEVHREAAYDEAMDALHAVASFNADLLAALGRYERLHAAEVAA